MASVGRRGKVWRACSKVWAALPAELVAPGDRVTPQVAKGALNGVLRLLSEGTGENKSAAKIEWLTAAVAELQPDKNGFVGYEDLVDIAEQYCDFAALAGEPLAAAGVLSAAPAPQAATEDASFKARVERLCHQAFRWVDPEGMDALNPSQAKTALTVVFRRLKAPMPPEEWHEEVFENFDENEEGLLDADDLVDIAVQYCEAHLGADGLAGGGNAAAEPEPRAPPPLGPVRTSPAPPKSAATPSPGLPPPASNPSPSTSSGYPASRNPAQGPGWGARPPQGLSPQPPGGNWDPRPVAQPGLPPPAWGGPTPAQPPWQGPGPGFGGPGGGFGPGPGSGPVPGPSWGGPRPTWGGPSPGFGQGPGAGSGWGGPQPSWGGSGGGDFGLGAPTSGPCPGPAPFSSSTWQSQGGHQPYGHGNAPYGMNLSQDSRSAAFQARHDPLSMPHLPPPSSTSSHNPSMPSLPSMPPMSPMPPMPATADRQRQAEMPPMPAASTPKNRSSSPGVPALPTASPSRGPLPSSPQPDADVAPPPSQTAARDSLPLASPPASVVADPAQAVERDTQLLASPPASVMEAEPPAKEAEPLAGEKEVSAEPASESATATPSTTAPGTLQSEGTLEGEPPEAEAQEDGRGQTLAPVPEEAVPSVESATEPHPTADEQKEHPRKSVLLDRPRKSALASSAPSRGSTVCSQSSMRSSTSESSARSSLAEPTSTSGLVVPKRQRHKKSTHFAAQIEELLPAVREMEVQYEFPKTIRRRSTRQGSVPIAQQVMAPTHKDQMTVFDDYDFVEERGGGAFGRVMQVMHKEAGFRRACKSVAIRSKRHFASVETEVVLMRRLDHPNILRLFESYYDGDRNVYLIIELCTGGSLADRLKDVAPRPLPEDVTGRLTLQMLSAVQYCHKRGIVHRDLKPENILFSHGGEESPIKVIDFGLSDFRARLVRMDCQSFGSGTAKPMCIGTPHYMAPEIYNQNIYDEKVDAFACGIILAEVLTGRHPFFELGKDNLQSIREKIINGLVDWQGAHWSPVDHQAKDLTCKLLQTQRETRLTLADALRHPWVSALQKEAAKELAAVSLSSDVFECLERWCSWHVLGQASSRVLARQLDDEQMAVPRLDFRLLDKNGDGVLSAAELLEGSRKCGISLMTEDVAQLMQVFDRTGALGRKPSGVGAPTYEITWTDFQAATLERGLEPREEQLLYVFRRFAGESQIITPESLQESLSSWQLSTVGAESGVAFVPPSNDGEVVSREELDRVFTDVGAHSSLQGWGAATRLIYFNHFQSMLNPEHRERMPTA